VNAVLNHAPTRVHKLTAPARLRELSRMADHPPWSGMQLRRGGTALAARALDAPSTKTVCSRPCRTTAACSRIVRRARMSQICLSQPTRAPFSNHPCQGVSRQQRYTSHSMGKRKSKARVIKVARCVPWPAQQCLTRSPCGRTAVRRWPRCLTARSATTPRPWSAACAARAPAPCSSRIARYGQ
jgi:hypothetical protein